MLVKIVTFFLLGMAVLAMFGRLRLPGRKKPSAPRVKGPVICGKCGSYILGDGPCACGAPSGKKG